MEKKKPDTRNRATRNKQERQESLRELLSKQGHLQHVVDLCAEVANDNNDLDPLMVQRKKIVIDTKLKLINKYLPDLKGVEISGEGGGDLVIKVTNYADNA